MPAPALRVALLGFIAAAAAATAAATATAAASAASLPRAAGYIVAPSRAQPRSISWQVAGLPGPAEDRAGRGARLRRQSDHGLFTNPVSRPTPYPGWTVRRVRVCGNSIMHYTISNMIEF